METTNYNPIILNTDEVIATLEGHKFMKRIPISTQPPEIWDSVEAITNESGGVISWNFYKSSDPISHGYIKKIPYKVGDVLWVQETWQYGANAFTKQSYLYKASPEQEATDGYASQCFGPTTYWKSSSSMPREASRIFLRVTDVTVHRLNKIGLGSIYAEGCPEEFERIPDKWFQMKWDKSYGKRNEGKFAWDNNPWVWALSFKHIDKPADFK